MVYPSGKESLKKKIAKGKDSKISTIQGKYPKYDFDVNYLDPKEKTVSKKFWSDKS
jgi:hypothetical protein